jgi:signal peptidase I
MTDEPAPPRRLDWPHPRFARSEDPEDVRDPAGNWLPEEQGAKAEAPPVIDSMLYPDRRFAPQHGAFGRSESALPGAFLFPEPEPRHEPGPVRELEPAAETTSRETHRRGLFIRELVETLLLAVLVFLAVRSSVQHYRVEGHSMDPNLDDGEFLLVNSLVYSELNLEKLAKWVPLWDPGEPDTRHVFHAPERGDVVVLHPRQRENRDLVKRIIGLPGERLEIRDGVVLINGRELIEPYIREPWSGSFGEIIIPEDFYFVMGDNRKASADSRSFGPVNEDDIVGKAMASWWPRESIGLAPNESPRLGAER